MVAWKEREVARGREDARAGRERGDSEESRQVKRSKVIDSERGGRRWPLQKKKKKEFGHFRRCGGESVRVERRKKNTERRLRFSEPFRLSCLSLDASMSVVEGSASASEVRLRWGGERGGE